MGIEDTKGVGISYPARGTGRLLAEEMIEKGKKGELINDGVTYSSTPKPNENTFFFDKPEDREVKKPSELDNAIEEVFNDLADLPTEEIEEELEKMMENHCTCNGDHDCGDNCQCATTEKDNKMTEAKSVNMGQDANAGQARDDSTTSTRLLDKNWSPLVVRKYQMEGWPMFIGIICDANLNDLDKVVYEIWKEATDLGFVNGTIQGHRNCCGLLSDRLVAHYNKEKQGVMEGNCVFWYTDKLAISSAYGDLMTHNKCAMEFYSILQMMPHI